PLPWTPQLSPLAWKPPLGPLPWTPLLGPLPWTPLLGPLPWTPLLGPLAWKPRTRAAANWLPRYGSSPEPSAMRPHRGSRHTSTMGAKIQSVPFALASSAASLAARSTSPRSHVHDSASGIGKIVR